jgi:hypothetical protein
MLGFIAHRCPALETHVENSRSEKVAAKTMTVHPDHNKLLLPTMLFAE